MKTNTPFKSSSKDKKLSVYAYDGRQTKLIHFGAKGYSDFTIHKDEDRKKRYIQRHQENENWNKSGLFTAGFWSRWILWNKDNLADSIRDAQKRFNLVIKSV